MKYIRTKDGRIVDTEKEYSNHPANYPIQVRDYGLTVKQADTIEELCDEFVIHNFRAFKKPYIPDSVNIKDIPIELFKKCDMHLYGAIWTDKGLIYVAEMNDKGELELI